MVFEQQGITLIENKAKTVHSPEENETILKSFTSFIRTVEYKVSLFQKLGYAFEMYQIVPEK